MEGYEDEHEGTEEDEEKRIVMEAVRSLASTLVKKRDEAVEFRAASGVERRWREDQAAFDEMGPDPFGVAMIDYATGEAPINNQNSANRSTVTVNITRGKVETAVGRFADIQFPVDDKNWGLRVTPIPDIVEGLKDDRQAAQNGQPLKQKDGSPMKISDIAVLDQTVAKEKMKAMELAIDDQLTECKYNAENRKVIASSARLGTGIIKGPNVIRSIKKSWSANVDEQTKEEVQIFTGTEDMQPASKEVSCWDVYPDPDVEEDISRAAYIWEKGTILPRELRDLYGADGYFDDQIIAVLKEEPQRIKIGYDEKQGVHSAKRSTLSMGNLYQIWYYYGDLNREDLESLNVDLSHDEIAQSFSACVVMVNDKPIKVCLNVLDTGDMPYDFFQWSQVAGSPWGIGVSRQIIWLQRIITAAWRKMMDNAGDSSGANVVIGPNLEPADGNWELTGKKLWVPIDDAGDFDIRREFAQFQIANNQEELQAIIEFALRFIDMETSMPMLFQGEKGEAPETLGATNIMVDAFNVALRTRVKIYDDQITVPHLTRYYHYNMQYNPNPEIKGDFSVDARGTSVLLEKDQKAQTLVQLMASKADPVIDRKVNWDKATDQMVNALKMGDILKSEDELKAYDAQKAKQPQQQDPRIAAAKINRDTTIEKAKIDQQGDMAGTEAKKVATSEELNAKAVEAQRERDHSWGMQEMALKVKMMEFAEKRNMSLDQIKGKLSTEAMKNKTKIKTDTDKLNVQVALTDKAGKAPQIATPVVEPPGKAPDGEAFTK